MAERLAGLGVELEEGPVTRPWNTREIVVAGSGWVPVGVL